MSATLKFGSGLWATKKDSLLAYNDENGNFKPLPFSFSRASNATVVNEQGLIELVGSDEPRIDFKGNTKGSLLLEPTRSNLVTYSENFNNWSKSGWTLTSGLLAPNGSLDAYSVLRTTGSTFAQSATLLSNTTYTFSAYIKNVNATNIQLRVQNQAGNTIGTESNCIVFSVTEQTNDSNFTRITHTFNTGDAGSYGLFLGYYSAGEYIVYGAQLEQGSYATSYIPTSGSAVTRVYDTMPSYLDVTPLNIGNSYTLFLDANLNVNDNNKVFGAINNSVGGLSFTMRNNVGGIRLYNHIDDGYPVSGIISSTNKFVIRVDGNSYKIFVQGASLSGTLTTQRNLGALLFNGQNTELKINNFKIDNTALSDAECESLVN